MEAIASRLIPILDVLVIRVVKNKSNSRIHLRETRNRETVGC